MSKNILIISSIISIVLVSSNLAYADDAAKSNTKEISIDKKVTAQDTKKDSKSTVNCGNCNGCF